MYSFSLIKRFVLKGRKFLYHILKWITCESFDVYIGSLTVQENGNERGNDIIELLGFILTTTYFQLFDGQIYRLIGLKFGAAMGSTVSPIVANLFMEDLEQTVLSTPPPTIRPRLWKRYVNEVLAIVKEDSAYQLKNHLNQAEITGA